MNDAPLVNPRDRFPLGLPGHTVPASPELPTKAGRPWGMDYAVAPRPIRLAGKHEKPTSTRQEKVKTQYTDDSKTKSDDYTQTVTD